MTLEYMTDYCIFIRHRTGEYIPCLILYELLSKLIDETLFSLSSSDYKHTKEQTIHVHKYICISHFERANNSIYHGFPFISDID